MNRENYDTLRYTKQRVNGNRKEVYDSFTGTWVLLIAGCVISDTTPDFHTRDSQENRDDFSGRDDGGSGGE